MLTFHKIFKIFFGSLAIVLVPIVLWFLMREAFIDDLAYNKAIIFPTVSVALLCILSIRRFVPQLSESVEDAIGSFFKVLPDRISAILSYIYLAIVAGAFFVLLWSTFELLLYLQFNIGLVCTDIDCLNV
ncbi:MAG: hypothetical protein Q8P93_00035 [bacterium]|nr:hypothetical protein [bacterium]